LADTGFVEGRNIVIRYRWAENHYERLPAFAADLVRQKVSVILTSANSASALAAKAATSTIPIVFSIGADPVKIGLVTNLARPDRNITGVTLLTSDLAAKRFDFLHEVVPAASSIGFLTNPTSPGAEAEKRDVEVAAAASGVRLLVLNVSGRSDVETAFAQLVHQGIDAVVTQGDPIFYNTRDLLIPLAARYGKPIIYHLRQTVEAGGLMSYAADISDANRITGTYVGRILKGEKPADLPVQRATKIELAINMKTAKALGLEFPLDLLGRADEVIE
jgi:putative ABC transport system substrate-binding protein